jgi:hypothetical protein
MLHNLDFTIFLPSRLLVMLYPCLSLLHHHLRLSRLEHALATHNAACFGVLVRVVSSTLAVEQKNARFGEKRGGHALDPVTFW